MNMITDYWVLAAFISKVLLYLGVAFSIGGFFSYQLLFSRYGSYPALATTIIRYIAAGAFLGLLASIAAFLVQVGSFANNGLTGMLDPALSGIILHSPSGHVQLGRVAAFALITTLACYKLYARTLRWNMAEQLVMLFSCIYLAVSFALLGHATNLGPVAQILISLHVLGISLWMGALFPLWKASRYIQGQPLQDSMHLFGKVASLIVAILVICGASVAVLLFKDLQTLTGTLYGQFFLLKLALVSVLLLLAALNKWLITPRLSHHANGAVFAGKMARHLSYLITVEMLVGLSILGITAALTTIIGIE